MLKDIKMTSLLSQPRFIESVNPNLLTGNELLTGTLSDTLEVYPEKKDEKQIQKPLNLPFKSIFEQTERKMSLFDEPQKVEDINPNLLTFREYDYLVEGEKEEDKTYQIINSNDALKNDNFILAEQLLGRSLTQNEIARKRVSDEILHTLSGSEPLYKSLENMNLVYDIRDKVDQDKLSSLMAELKANNIYYNLTQLDDTTIQIKSYKKGRSVLFPRPIVMTEREEEEKEASLPGGSSELPEVVRASLPTGDISEVKERSLEELRKLVDKDYFESKYNIPVTPSNYKSKINQTNKGQLLEWALTLGLSLSQDVKISELQDILRKRLEDDIITSNPPGGLKKEIPEKIGLGFIKTNQRYLPFGKYQIDTKALNDKIIKFKTVRGHKVLRLPETHISSRMAKFLSDLLTNQRLDETMYTYLTNNEKSLFQDILTISKVDLDKSQSQSLQKSGGVFTDNQLLKRLQTLIGSLTAGNDSKDLKNEISIVLNGIRTRKLMHPKTITKMYKMVYGRI